jgi:hypothetical protein
VADQKQSIASLAAAFWATLRRDFVWILQHFKGAFSWEGIGWIVALLIGLWGTMVGVEAFVAAYIFLGIVIVLCVAKCAEATHLRLSNRRIPAFTLMSLAVVGIAAPFCWWTHSRVRASEEANAKLAPLAEIPGLRHQVADLLPVLGQVQLLRNQLDAANRLAGDRQTVIEGLDRLLIEQGASLKKLGVETQLDLAGEPASSADVMAGPNSLDPGDIMGRGNAVMVFNTGKRRMEEVNLEVKELINTDEPIEKLIAKIKEVKNYSLGAIPPGTYIETGIKLPVFPPNNLGWSFSVTSKGGGSSQTVYRTVTSPGQKGSVQVERYVNGKLLPNGKRPAVK